MEEAMAYFRKSFILDIWLGSEYAFGTAKVYNSFYWNEFWTELVKCFPTIH